MESMPHAEPLLSSVESVPHGEQLLSSVESVPHAEPLPSVEYVLHGKPLSSVESMSSVGSMPHGEPLQLTFDAFALGRATRPKRVKPPGGHRVLSRAQESLAALGMIMELAKHDLLLSPNQQQVFGSRVLEPHSQRVYKKHYRGLWYFFGLIGDYTSLLILRHDCPQHAPAMSVKSLCAYLKYKTGAIGTILHYDDGLPVLDVDGQPVLCDGQWKDPQNMIQLSSAVSAAHKAKGMGQVPYEEQYDACYRLFSDKSLVTGCRHHAGRGRLSRTGNARFSEDFIKCMTRIRNHDLWLYTPSSESMCKPLELVNIRRYLLVPNQLMGWKLWTMMIFHIRLSFRADEGIDVMCSQFLPPLTSVDEFGTVTMLDVQISGKTGKKKWIVLSLYRDDQCPELCPVRAVLAWIHLSRHPGTGYLFPHDKDATKCYPPATFQTKCRNVCTKVTGRQGPFATHALAPQDGLASCDMGWSLRC
ncbi:hypothetical protein DYB37_010252 [Aphanomyces astaci]|uniref:Uncharacterized protein n=1 Tax=Aphanomyces astaci TaxID=112090 RepID=A0A418EFS9_APHAT|nr:hypothetical protein DYB37_010252 [Aphanomyces astaci]